MQSLNIPSTFRNPNQYTAAEILEALQGATGSRRFSFRYELLDENNVKTRDLDTVRKGSITQNWLADIKRTASFELRSELEDPIDYLKDRIKPWVRLHMPPKELPDPNTVLPPASPTPPAFAALQDDFESAEMSSEWTFYADGVANVGGKLRIPTKPSYPGAASNSTWSLTGSSVSCEVNRVPSLSGGTDVAVGVTINSGTVGTNLTIQYRLTGFGLENRMEFLNFDSGFSDPGSVDIEYDPDEHRWWRIREEAGTVYWETSRTGLPGTWQVQRDEPTPAWVVLEDQTLELFIQANGDVGGDGGGDYAELDNVNLTPEGVATEFMPQQEWFNNFNGTPGVDGVGRLEVLATNGTTSAGDEISVTVPNDGSVVVGDLLIVGAALASGVRTMNLTSAATGWTDHGRVSVSGHGSEVWTKIATSAELGDTITVTPSTPDIPQVIMLAKVSNVDQTNPLGSPVAVQGTAFTTTSTTHNASPTITGTAADTREISLVFDSQQGDHDWNAPFPIIQSTNGYDHSITAAGGSTFAVGDNPTRTSGTIGNRSWTKDIASYGSAWTIGVLGAETVEAAESITPNNSARHGNALDDVQGVAIYDDAYSIDDKKSAKLGDDSGASGGTLVTRLRSPLSEWSTRLYYFLPPGGVLSIQPDGANPSTSNDILIDDNTSTVTLGTVDVPDYLKPNFVGRLVKLEIITTETLTVYHLFWTDPTGDSPDYVTSEDNTGRDPLLTLTVSAGGSSTPPAWVDNLLISEPRTYVRFTDESVNYVEWPQGVFILSSPQRESDEADVITRTVQGYDLAQVLEDEQTADRFSTANLLRVDDNFTRDVTGSWGTSDDGTVWLQAAADADFGVTSTLPGYAYVTLLSNPSNIRLFQAGNTQQEILTDSEVYTRIAVDQLATGASFLPSVVFRLFSINDYYRCRVHHLTDGTIGMSVTRTATQYGDFVSSGLSYTTGTFVNVRAQCIGHVVRGKVWADGTSEPAGWLIEEDITADQIEYGYTGLSGSTFGGNTNVNPMYQYDTFQLNPNPNNTYTGVVEHILTEANLPKRITESAATIPEIKEWEAGTTKRQIINDLLDAINYESLSFDEDGFAVVKPYISPQDRGSEYTYQDNELSVMYPEVMQELDLYAIPNRWILTVSDPDRDTIVVDFTNADPASPTSTVRRGRTITEFVQEQDADSEATLIEKASRLAFESSQVYEAIEFDTGLMPIHSGNDVYTLVYDILGINGQYAEVSWDMDLEAGAKMSHRARRVISLVAAQDPSILDDDLEVTGALEAGNIAVGIETVTPVANKPTKYTVSGLDLQGRGPVRVFATAESTVPGSSFREVTTADHTPFGFSIWVYRTNTTSTNIHWMAVRGA